MNIPIQLKTNDKSINSIVILLNKLGLRKDDFSFYDLKTHDEDIVFKADIRVTWRSSSTSISKEVGIITAFDSELEKEHYLNQKIKEIKVWAVEFVLSDLVRKYNEKSFVYLKNGMSLGIPDIHTSHKSDCSACSNSSVPRGKDKCRVGNGDRYNCRIFCGTCSGRGYYESGFGDDRKFYTCSPCNGAGNTPCYNCSGTGLVECSVCRGYGYLIITSRRSFQLAVSRKISLKDSNKTNQFIDMLNTLSPDFVFNLSAVEDFSTVSSNDTIRTLTYGRIKRSFFNSKILKNLYSFETIGKDAFFVNMPEFVDDLFIKQIDIIRKNNSKNNFISAISMIKETIFLFDIFKLIGLGKFNKKELLESFKGGLSQNMAEIIKDTLTTTFQSIAETGAHKLWIFSYCIIFLVSAVFVASGIERIYYSQMFLLYNLFDSAVVRRGIFFISEALPGTAILIATYLAAEKLSIKAITKLTGLNQSGLKIRPIKQVSFSFLLIFLGLTAGVNFRSTMDYKLNDWWIPKRYEKALNIELGPIAGSFGPSYLFDSKYNDFY